MRLAFKIARIAGPLVVAGVCLGTSIGAGCGRIGIDFRTDDAAQPPDEVLPDATPDGPPDTATLQCPTGTTEIAPGASTCIELEERGVASWITADAECASVGRRLCTDAEWVQACAEATGLVDIVDDQGGGGSGSSAANWEWTADSNGSAATKRGLFTCDDMSSHQIDSDPYDFRCCAPKS